MQKSYDVVVIGGGVAGSAVAYFLTRNPDFKGTVAVIERDSTYATASSSLSASGMRQQFGTPPNIGMSTWSVDFIRNAAEHLSVDDNIADVGFHDDGYLILGDAGKRDGFLARAEVQRQEGVDVDLLSADALADRFPDLNVEDIGIASLGTRNEGWFDGPALHQAYKRRARKQGAEYLAGTVTGLDMAADRIAAVRIGDQAVACGAVVNAAGSWSGGVAALAGVDLPVVPRKRCVFVIESPAKVPLFLHDSSGIWIRPEGKLYICGTTPEVENAPDDFSLDVDYALFDDIIWPALAHRVPAFEQLRMLRAWAGHYDYNLFDHSAIIGRIPTVRNFVMANGFSGHGMMHSPATGLSVSEIIVYDEARTLDVSAFTFERIAANRPILEHVY